MASIENRGPFGGPVRGRIGRGAPGPAGRPHDAAVLADGAPDPSEYAGHGEARPERAQDGRARRAGLSMGAPRPGESLGGRLSAAMTYLGAAVSVALIAGLGVWGYRLAMRDVSGVPVIQAIDGPARVAPENPGGDLARHVGLSVNSVAALGTAAPAPDRVVLAPRPIELVEEDAPMAGLAPLEPAPGGEDTAAAQDPAAPVPVPDNERPVAAIDGIDALRRAAAEAATGGLPADSDDAEAARALALAESLSLDAVPQAGDPRVLPAESGVPAPAMVAPIEVIPASVPGPSRSLRPLARPEGDVIALAAAEAVARAFAPEPEIDVDAASLASGTRLVQLGAFDTPEAARAEWSRIAARFETLMAGKRRVIQEAQSGGRSFYRLRVEGFADVADARQFCAALVAEQANCIPAQVR